MSCKSNFNSHVSKGTTQDAKDWLLRFAEPPHRPRFVVDVGLLPNETLKAELLFVLQSWDEQRSGVLDPTFIASLIRLARAQQLASFTDAVLVEQMENANARYQSFGRFMSATLEAAQRRYVGYDPNTADTLYLQDLPLREIVSSPRISRSEVKALDLAEIPQTWLREALRKWILTTLDTRNNSLIAFNVCVIASRALTEHRSDHGMDSTLLHAEDMTIIVRSIHKALVQSDSNEPNHDTLRGYLRHWWKVVDSARRFGMWNDVPSDFAKDPKLHGNRGVKTQPGELGRALPSAVVVHLRNSTEALSDATQGVMKVAAMNVLMDTGRRPNEVVSLHRDCLTYDSAEDGWWLQWDNHKAKRMGRRLPIDTETADAIRTWQAQLEESQSATRWLFPTSQKNVKSGDRHVNSQWLGSVLRELVARVPPITTPVLGIDGQPMTVDLAEVTPYDFRHSYAQRMADAGVDVDVLRELMDHQNVNTTLGYYSVSAKRKREAAKQVAPLTVNNHGHPVGVDELRQGLSTVAVPYGGCSEPKNISAGGTQCPVRFQCASCRFYRPDPSYLPDIERHIADLKMNLAASRQMNAPIYVQDNFKGQIDDYQKVVDQMRSSLEAMPEAERADIEFAATVLRRARAAESQGLALTLGVDPATHGAKLRDAAGLGASQSVFIPLHVPTGDVE